MFEFARHDGEIFVAFVMRAREYKVGLTILAIVIGYLSIFEILRVLQENTAVGQLNGDAFDKPSQQQLLFNSRAYLTFFDIKKFIQLKIYDEDSSPCISTKLPVLILVAQIIKERSKQSKIIAII